MGLLFGNVSYTSKMIIGRVFSIKIRFIKETSIHKKRELQSIIKYSALRDRLKTSQNLQIKKTVLSKPTLVVIIANIKMKYLLNCEPVLSDNSFKIVLDKLGNE